VGEGAERRRVYDQPNNTHDLELWTKGLEKLDAGERLTDAEHEVLTYFGGDAMLRRLVPRPRLARKLATKRPIEHADMDGKLSYLDLPGTLTATETGGVKKLHIK
jgi:hypothetical protein